MLESGKRKLKAVAGSISSERPHPRRQHLVPMSYMVLKAKVLFRDFLCKGIYTIPEGPTLMIQLPPEGSVFITSVNRYNKSFRNNNSLRGTNLPLVPYSITACSMNPSQVPRITVLLSLPLPGLMSTFWNPSQVRVLCVSVWFFL